MCLKLAYTFEMHAYIYLVLTYTFDVHACMCLMLVRTFEVHACTDLVLVCISACTHASTSCWRARRRTRMYVPRAGLHIRRARMHMLHAGLDIDVPVCIRYVLACRAMCWLTAQCTCLQAASGGLQMRYPGFETGVQACSFLLPACSSVSVVLSSRHFRYDPQRVQRHRSRGTSYCSSPESGRQLVTN